MFEESLQQQIQSGKNFEISTSYSFEGDLPIITEDLIKILSYLKNYGWSGSIVGWGNWENGPRFIQAKASNEIFECNIVKKYYFSEENTPSMQVEETCNCKTKEP